MKGRRIALGRLGLAVAGTLLGGALAELALRIFRFDRYEVPLFVSADGADVDLPGPTARIFREAKERHLESSTDLPPATVWFGQYDRPRWSYFDAKGRVEYRTNRLGFRGPEFELARQPDELRVLALGDSFTFGLGVPEKDTWVRRLEALLAASRHGPVTVVNAGMGCGFEPSGYAAWLPSHVEALDPDVVVVGLCLNDVNDKINLIVGQGVDEREPPLHDALHVVTAVHQAYSLWKVGHAPPPRILARMVSGKQATDWRRCRDGLNAIQQLCDARGVRCLVVVFPMMTWLKHDYPLTEVHQLVRDFCTSRSIECVDLLDRFVGLDEQELWVHPRDQHPNDVGHHLIAEGIAAYLASCPLAPKPGH
jgi:lysophospholipase L1-like esterase